MKFFLLLLVLLASNVNNLKILHNKNNTNENSIINSLIRIHSISIKDNTTINGIGFIIDCLHSIGVSHIKLSSKFYNTTIQTLDGTSYTTIPLYENSLLSFSLFRIVNLTSTHCYQIKTESNSIPIASKVTVYGIELSSSSYILQDAIISKSNSNLSTRYGAMYKLSLSSNFNSIRFSHPYELSPVVFNNTVIGLHLYSSVSSKSLYALHIKYITNILTKLTNQQSDLVENGELGITLSLIDVLTAVNKYNFNIKKCKISSNTSTLISIANIIQGFNADNMLYIGDIILSVNNININSDLVLFDELLDDNVGRLIAIEVCRNGKKKKISVLVDNSQAYQTDRYYSVNNDIITDIDIKTRFMHQMFNMKGILYNSSVWVYRVNTRDIDSSDDLIQEISDNCNRNNILEGYDLIKRSNVNINVQWKEIQRGISKKEYSYSTHKWINENLSISHICKEKD